MITVDQVVAIALASFVLIIVPGPSVMFIVGRALSYGRSNALASIAGNSTGAYLVCIALAAGLGPIIAASDLLFQIIKWIGILYLFWLGIQAIRHAGPLVGSAPEYEAVVDSPKRESPKHESHWAAVRAGTIVGLTNPKSFIMFTAIVPQFIVPSHGNTIVQMLLLGLVPIAIGLVTDSAWAIVAGRARTWLARNPRRMTILGRIGGASIIGVGVSVALSGDHG